MLNNVMMESVSLKTDSILTYVVKEMRENKSDSIQVVCKDGNSLQVSSLLLSAISPFLAKIFSSVTLEESVLYLPDVNASSLIYVIDKILSLSTEPPGNDELHDLQEIFGKDSIFDSKPVFKVEYSVDPEVVTEPLEDSSAEFIEVKSEKHEVKVNTEEDSFDGFDGINNIKLEATPEPEEPPSSEKKRPTRKNESKGAASKRKSSKRKKKDSDSDEDEEDTDERPKRKLKTGTFAAKTIMEDQLPKDENFLIAHEKLKIFLSDQSDFSEPTKLWYKLHDLSSNVKKTFMKEMICPPCLKLFPRSISVQHFFKHIQRHKIENWRCPCAPSGKIRDLSSHVMVEHWNMKKCDHCDSILDPDVMDKHVRFNHKEKAKSRLCAECGADFRTKSQLEFKVHLEFHRAEKFSCTCNIYFETKRHKAHHMHVVHLKEWFCCDKCMFLCDEKNLLQDHVNKTHQNKESSDSNHARICDICGYVATSSNPRLIQDHKWRVHSPLLQCPHCPAKFTKAALTSHIRRVHQSGGICNICGIQVNRLDVHMKTVHLSKNLTRLKCDECGKGFHYSIKLRRHMMSVHVKARPYKCRYGCDLAYNDSSNRNQHEKKKHGTIFTSKTVDPVKDE